MSQNENELRRKIVEIGRIAFEKGWVAANDGNISIRLDERRILATPTGVSKGMMKPDDLIIVGYDGKKIEGRLEGTSEIAMHIAIYEARPDINSVVHAHPPTATGFASAGVPLNRAILPEVVIGLGCIPTAAYGLPGTPALTETLIPLIPHYDAILLANHGAVAYGKDLMQAYFRMETVEHFARINLVAEMLGGAKPLPRAEVDKLFDSRTRYGVRSKATATVGCPTVAEDLVPSAPRSSEDGFWVTRQQLVDMIEQAVQAREEKR
jgi:L-fuculose-phosphate aldolase